MRAWRLAALLLVVAGPAWAQGMTPDLQPKLVPPVRGSDASTLQETTKPREGSPPPATPVGSMNPPPTEPPPPAAPPSPQR
jgi:hypothetical protein